MGGVLVPWAGRGVKAPGPGRCCNPEGVVNPERRVVRESRMPERMATPMVPQPRTVRVSGGVGVPAPEDMVGDWWGSGVVGLKVMGVLAIVELG